MGFPDAFFFGRPVGCAKVYNQPNKRLTLDFPSFSMQMFRYVLNETYMFTRKEKKTKVRHIAPNVS